MAWAIRLPRVHIGPAIGVCRPSTSAIAVWKVPRNLHIGVVVEPSTQGLYTPPSAAPARKMGTTPRRFLQAPPPWFSLLSQIEFLPARAFSRASVEIVDRTVAANAPFTVYAPPRAFPHANSWEGGRLCGYLYPSLGFNRVVPFPFARLFVF